LEWISKDTDIARQFEFFARLMKVRPRQRNDGRFNVAPKHRSRAAWSTQRQHAQSALLRRIDLTTLRLFIAVCEEKNLTRGPSREGIAASAVSKRMADFELGIRP